MSLTLITLDGIRIPFDHGIACQTFHLIHDLVVDTRTQEACVDFTYDEWKEFFLMICGQPPETLGIPPQRLAYLTEYLDLDKIYRPIIENILVSTLVPKYLIKERLVIRDFLTTIHLNKKIKPRCQYIERSRGQQGKQCQHESQKEDGYCLTHQWFTSYLVNKK